MAWNASDQATKVVPALLPSASHAYKLCFTRLQLCFTQLQLSISVISSVHQFSLTALQSLVHLSCVVVLVSGGLHAGLGTSLLHVTRSRHDPGLGFLGHINLGLFSRHAWLAKLEILSLNSGKFSLQSRLSYLSSFGLVQSGCSTPAFYVPFIMGV